MKAPAVVFAPNGHVAEEQARRAASAEQRRREVAAAYRTLPDVLIESFERLALAQPPQAQLGSLMLVVAIRHRRAKEQARATV